MKLSRGAVALCALIAPLLAVDGYAASADDAPPPAKTATESAPPAASEPAAPPAASAPAPAPAAPPPAAAPVPTPPAGAKAAGADAAKGKMDGATYAVRLRDLEARVDELKEQIRRSHTRLSLLSDTILSG